MEGHSSNSIGRTPNGTFLLLLVLFRPTGEKEPTKGLKSPASVRPKTERMRWRIQATKVAFVPEAEGFSPAAIEQDISL